MKIIIVNTIFQVANKNLTVKILRLCDNITEDYGISENEMNCSCCSPVPEMTNEIVFSGGHM